MAGASVGYIAVPLIVFFFGLTIRVCLRTLFRTQEQEGRRTNYILQALGTRQLSDGSVRIFDFEPEGIPLQQLPTHHPGLPKARQDLPYMPSLPPTYDEAVSGRDRSVTVEEHPNLVTTTELQHGGGGNQRTDRLEEVTCVGGDTSVGLLPEGQQLSTNRVLTETELLPPPPPYSSSSAPPMAVDDDEDEDSDGADQPLLPA